MITKQDINQINYLIDKKLNNLHTSFIGTISKINNDSVDIDPDIQKKEYNFYTDKIDKIKYPTLKNVKLLTPRFYSAGVNVGDKVLVFVQEDEENSEGLKTHDVSYHQAILLSGMSDYFQEQKVNINNENTSIYSILHYLEDVFIALGQVVVIETGQTISENNLSWTSIFIPKVNDFITLIQQLFKES